MMERTHHQRSPYSQQGSSRKRRWEYGVLSREYIEDADRVVDIGAIPIEMMLNDYHGDVVGALLCTRVMINSSRLL